MTGASGFIGTNLVRALVDNGCEVVALSRSRPKFVPLGTRWVHWSAGDEWPSLEVGHVNTVFHLAATTSAYSAQQEPRLTMDINALSVLRIIECVRNLKKSTRLVAVGSVTELNPGIDGTISDKSSTDPQTFYEISKATQRMLLNQCVREGWIDAVSILLPNVYGHWTESQGSNRGFLNASIRHALQGKELHYFRDGDYVRDYLYVTDAVDALLCAGTYSNLIRPSYVIGTGVGIPIREALDLIADVVYRRSGKQVKVVGISPPAGRYENERHKTIVFSTIFQNDAKWTPKFSLRSGIESVVDMYLRDL